MKLNKERFLKTEVGNYGIVTEDEADWLFKRERKESGRNGKEVQTPAV